MTARNTRVFCVVNPARKHHDTAWRLLQQHCAAFGFAPPELLTTTAEEPGGPQATMALDRGADLVIAAGGDGTVRNISNILATTGIPLGIIPTGTANIFHLNAIGKQKRLDQAVRTALIGTNRSVDTGLARLDLQDGTSVSERFLVVVGVGRDAISLDRVSERAKRMIGPAAYFASGAVQLTRQPIEMSVTVDGELLDVKAAWSVLVGNCGVVPGGITILPGASLIDGELNILHIAPRSLFRWLPIAWRGLRGKASSVSGIEERIAAGVTIIPETPLDVQVDGDVTRNVVRVHVEVDPGSLIIRGRELDTDGSETDG